jgi:hypothetical protein
MDVAAVATPGVDAAPESESNAALASGMLFLLEWHCQGQWA